MDFKDYYKTLDLSPTANAAEIKAAFRKAARKYHPDINTGADAEAKFKEVNEAHEVLKDPERRAAYDQLGQEPQPAQGGFRPPPDWDSGYEFSQSDASNGEAFSDFFETLFRRGSNPAGGRGRRPSADSHGRIEITIEDAYQGAERTLNLRAPVMGPNGTVTMQNRKIAVRVPKGIGQGQHIRLAGQGTSEEGSTGDLLLEVAFAPHPVYRPEGKDLYMDLPVAPWEAALGGHVVMPTPGGRINLNIPKNARSGQKLRLKGKGMPGMSGAPAGNIYATLKIVNPEVTTEHARAFFEKMAEEMPFDPRADLGGDGK